MRFFVDESHVLWTRIGVDLRRCHAFVPKQLLDGAEVGAVFDEMRGERMTQRMQRNAGYTGSGRRLFNNRQ
jgi:hypothetical protein